MLPGALLYNIGISTSIRNNQGAFYGEPGISTLGFPQLPLGEQHRQVGLLHDLELFFFYFSLTFLSIVTRPRTPLYFPIVLPSISLPQISPLPPRQNYL